MYTVKALPENPEPLPPDNVNYPVYCTSRIKRADYFFLAPNSISPNFDTFAKQNNLRMYMGARYPDHSLSNNYTLDYQATIIRNGFVWHHFSGGKNYDLSNRGWLMSMSLTWVVDDHNEDSIVRSLENVNRAPEEVTHLALYSTMPPNIANDFLVWLYGDSNESPPAAALSYSLSFSPNQAGLAFNYGRFVDEPNAKGIVWHLFKLFKGDETKWWAWLVKGLDLVVDVLIATFVGRLGIGAVVPIGSNSGFRAEAVGLYDRELIRGYTDRVPLEYIPSAGTRSLVDVMAEIDNQNVQHTHLFARAARHLSAEKATPIAPKSQSPSPGRSRRSSRVHQAKHPSPKKKLFR